MKRAYLVSNEGRLIPHSHELTATCRIFCRLTHANSTSTISESSWQLVVRKCLCAYPMTIVQVRSLLYYSYCYPHVSSNMLLHRNFVKIYVLSSCTRLLCARNTRSWSTNDLPILYWNWRSMDGDVSFDSRLELCVVFGSMASACLCMSMSFPLDRCNLRYRSCHIFIPRLRNTVATTVSKRPGDYSK